MTNCVISRENIDKNDYIILTTYPEPDPEIKEQRYYRPSEVTYYFIKANHSHLFYRCPYTHRADKFQAIAIANLHPELQNEILSFQSQEIQTENYQPEANLANWIKTKEKSNELLWTNYVFPESKNHYQQSEISVSSVEEFISEFNTRAKCLTELKFIYFSSTVQINYPFKQLAQAQIHCSTNTTLDFKNTILINAILSNINLSDKDFTNSNFYCAEISNVAFFQTNLTNTNFSGAVLTDVTLQYANLTKANFSGTEFNSVSFNNVTSDNLKDTNFSYSDLSRVNITGKQLLYAHLYKTRLNISQLIELYRNGKDLSNIYMREADFTKMKLSGIKLRRANLINTILKNTDLTNADLQEVDLRYANLEKANLTSANFSYAEITGANFDDNTIIDDTIFNYTDLSTTNIDGAKLINSSLHHARLNSLQIVRYLQCKHDKVIPMIDLSGQVLCDLKLQKTLFTEGMFNKANLTDTDLSEAVLVNSQFIGAILNNTKLNSTKLSNAILERANLSNADLTSAMLDNANLNFTTLNKANCTNTNFISATLKSAKFNNTLLINAKLNNADLTEAILNKADLRGADLRNAIIDSTTFKNCIMNENTLFYGENASHQKKLVQDFCDEYHNIKKSETGSAALQWFKTNFAFDTVFPLLEGDVNNNISPNPAAAILEILLHIKTHPNSRTEKAWNNVIKNVLTPLVIMTKTVGM